MKNALKSELKKLLTIRSTLIILILGWVITLLAGFLAMGIKADPASGQNPDLFSTGLLSLISGTSILTAILGVLVFTHEYRYNLISYSLTNTSSRAYLLISKIISVSLFSIVYGLSLMAVFYLGLRSGLSIADISLVDQQIDMLSLFGKVLFTVWGASMFGLILGGLIRNQVGSLITLVIAPGMVEGLLGFLLLKDNAVYLPFSALNGVTSTMPKDADPSIFIRLSPTESALVVLIYVIVGWLITLWLLKKRDAN